MCAAPDGSAGAATARLGMAVSGSNSVLGRVAARREQHVGEGRLAASHHPRGRGPGWTQRARGCRPGRPSVEVTIQAVSIRTHNETRDNDLRSSNFLEVDKFPTITIKSTSVAPAGPDRCTLTGDLTIKGTTRPVALQAIKYGEFNDPMMGHRIAYSASSQINRKEFGLNFNMMLDGRFVLSDEIQIMIEGELVEQQPAEATSG
jgi:polyisoprenoid-binding protein YceI